MEREVKHVTLSMVMMENRPRISVKAYTTKIAGVVVAPKREYVLRKGVETVVRRNHDWCIWTYPVGLRLLAGIPTKEQAIEFAEEHLHKYQWIGLVKEDITKNNDMNAMYSDFIKYRQMIAQMPIRV